MLDLILCEGHQCHGSIMPPLEGELTAPNGEAARAPKMRFVGDLRLTYPVRICYARTVLAALAKVNGPASCRSYCNPRCNQILLTFVLLSSILYSTSFSG